MSPPPLLPYLSYHTHTQRTHASTHTHMHARTHAHTHTHICFTALWTLSGITQVSGTRKVKPIGILLKQEIVSGSGISWATCKSAPHPKQITMPAPHHSVFTGWMPFLPPNQQRQSIEGNWAITIWLNKECEYFNALRWSFFWRSWSSRSSKIKLDWSIMAERAVGWCRAWSDWISSTWNCQWWLSDNHKHNYTCSFAITTLCLKKTSKLWNGIARNYKDRLWRHLAEMFKIL